MINSYENGRWRVLDFETQVKSIRMSWFKRLYASGWEWYFTFLLKPVGGLFLLPCNNDPKDQISSMQSWYSSGLSLGTPSLIRKIKAQLHMSGCLKMVLKNWIPALSRRFFQSKGNDKEIGRKISPFLFVHSVILLSLPSFLYFSPFTWFGGGLRSSEIKVKYGWYWDCTAFMNPDLYRIIKI